MHKYIVHPDDVGFMATAAVLQDSRLYMEKDKESAFYIISTEDDVDIPIRIRALKMTEEETQPSKPTARPGRKLVELRLCLDVPESINRPDLEKKLYNEITRALKKIINDTGEPPASSA